MIQTGRKRLRAEFLRKASKGFDWIFDPNRQADRRTFTQRDNRAMDIGLGLAKWVIEQHVGKDTRAKPSASAGTCPQCGAAAKGPDVGELESREVTSRAGEMRIARR